MTERPITKRKNNFNGQKRQMTIKFVSEMPDNQQDTILFAKSEILYLPTGSAAEGKLTPTISKYYGKKSF